MTIQNVGILAASTRPPHSSPSAAAATPQRAIANPPATFHKYGDMWTLVQSEGLNTIYWREGECGRAYEVFRWRYRPDRGLVFSLSEWGKSGWRFSVGSTPETRARALELAHQRFTELMAREEGKA